MPDTFVQSFTHLKDRPKADRALPMLQRVASLVKPIMRKHNWVLPVLAEFFPDSDNLVGLNVNMGQQILLRLRPAHAPDAFYEEEDVVQVMLHELTHNVHGPHDDKFYKFLSGLQDEYDQLQQSGYAGEGFFSKGQRLGVNVSHDLPPHLARTKTLEAAEKRRQVSKILGTGQNKLGGRLIMKNMTPAQMAAQAAERRARDEKACASGAVAEREASKAAKESIKDRIIDLTQDDSDSEVIILDQAAPGPPREPRSTSTSTSLIPPPLSEQKRARGKPLTQPQLTPTMETLIPSQWECQICTLLNQAHVLQCDACLTRKPLDDATGWVCFNCGLTGMPHEYWTCQSCGVMKAES
ncbi:WLM domain-containing protein [Infundibulicybe gibba]|nr:WLM domain-containing protein [Infundibulicybe gibba]